MKSPHTSLEGKHLPVMIDEVLKVCNPKKGEIFMDCTFGGGGYSRELLKFKETKVVALDRDTYVTKLAEKLKDKFVSNDIDPIHKEKSGSRSPKRKYKK